MSKKLTDLSLISEEELLNLKMRDLPLKIEETWLENCIKELYSELDSKGLKFKPLCYLADEWLTPDGEPVVGIPFFLAHPVLIKLERKMMLEVEGDTRQWCMKLLRHETGHAINYAYRLYKRKKWQKIFGKFSREYADTYRFRRYSKNFVRHLESYYAQYHPDEDFAETFAVWLTPDLDWQTQYKGWSALCKLKYLDELMGKIKNRQPLVKEGKKYWQSSSLRITLKNYYNRKKRVYAEDFPDFHDANLKRIFTERDKKNEHLTLVHYLIKKYRKNILVTVSAWTGEKKYVIDDLLTTIIRRCRALKLVAPESESITVLKISIYITASTMNYIFTGKFRSRK